MNNGYENVVTVVVVAVSNMKHECWSERWNGAGGLRKSQNVHFTRERYIQWRVMGQFRSPPVAPLPFTSVISFFFPVGPDSLMLPIFFRNGALCLWAESGNELEKEKNICDPWLCSNYYNIFDLLAF